MKVSRIILSDNFYQFSLEVVVKIFCYRFSILLCILTQFLTSPIEGYTEIVRITVCFDALDYESRLIANRSSLIANRSSIG